MIIRFKSLLTYIIYLQSSKNSKKQKKNKKTKTNTSGKGLVLADWMKAIGNGKIGIKFKNPVKALKQKKKKSKSSKDAFVDVKDMEEVELIYSYEYKSVLLLSRSRDSIFKVFNAYRNSFKCLF